MASKKERRALMLMEALRIIRDSLKVPLLSDNLVADMDNCSSGAIPVVVMPEAKRGSVFLDEGVSLVGEPDLFAGDVDVGKGELRVVDHVVDVGPGFPVPKLSSDGELEIGTVLAGAEVGSFPVEGSNSMPDVVFDVASREQSAIGEDEDSEDDEESQKFGDLSCPSKDPFNFAPESFSKRRREVSRHDVAFIWETAAHGYVGGRAAFSFWYRRTFTDCY